MALPITLPYTFATSTSSIPLANLDSDLTVLKDGLNGIYDGTNPLLTPILGNASATSLTAPQIVSTNTIGYKLGAGGTVTQITSRSTSVTLNKSCGSIVLFTQAQAANTTVGFSLTNSTIAQNDVLIVNYYTSTTANLSSYVVNAIASPSTPGFAFISIRNITAASLTDTLTINFAVIKSVTS